MPEESSGITLEFPDGSTQDFDEYYAELEGSNTEQVSGEIATMIVMDVAQKIPEDKSRVTYGPAEKAFRARVEAEAAELPEGTIIDVRE